MGKHITNNYIEKQLLLSEPAVVELQVSMPDVFSKIERIYEVLEGDAEDDLNVLVDSILFSLFSKNPIIEPDIPMSFINSKLGAFLLTVKYVEVKQALSVTEVLEMVNNAPNAKKEFTRMGIYQAAKRGVMKAIQLESGAWCFYREDVLDYMRKKKLL